MWKRRTPPGPGNPQPLPHFSASGQTTSSTRTTSTSTPPAPSLSFSSQGNVPAPSRKPLSRCPATSTFPNPAAGLLSFGVLQPTAKLSLRPETLFSNSRTATPQVVPTHGPSSVPFTRCLCPANLPAWAGRPPPSARPLSHTACGRALPDASILSPGPNSLASLYPLYATSPLRCLTSITDQRKSATGFTPKSGHCGSLPLHGTPLSREKKSRSRPPFLPFSVGRLPLNQVQERSFKAASSSPAATRLPRLVLNVDLGPRRGLRGWA